jgi:hypothetical protein
VDADAVDVQRYWPRDLYDGYVRSGSS